MKFFIVLSLFLFGCIVPPAPEKDTSDYTRLESLENERDLFFKNRYENVRQHIVKYENFKTIPIKDVSPRDVKKINSFLEKQDVNIMIDEPIFRNRITGPGVVGLYDGYRNEIILSSDFWRYNSMTTYYSILFHELSHYSFNRLNKTKKDVFFNSEMNIDDLKEEIISDISGYILMDYFNLDDDLSKYGIQTIRVYKTKKDWDEELTELDFDDLSDQGLDCAEFLLDENFKINRKVKSKIKKIKIFFKGI